MRWATSAPRAPLRRPASNEACAAIFAPRSSVPDEAIEVPAAARPAPVVARRGNALARGHRHGIDHPVKGIALQSVSRQGLFALCAAAIPEPAVVGRFALAHRALGGRRPRRRSFGWEDTSRFVRGEEVVSSTGHPVKVARPLDWLAILVPRAPHSTPPPPLEPRPGKEAKRVRRAGFRAAGRPGVGLRGPRAGRRFDLAALENAGRRRHRSAPDRPDTPPC